MRLTKKVMATVLAATMLASVLTGCGGGKDAEANSGAADTIPVTQELSNLPTESDTPKEVTKPTSIQWMVHSGLNEENGTAQWATEFERLTGIKMDLNIISNNEYKQVLELSFASDTVPDVFDLKADNLAVYAKQNAIADLTDYVKNSAFYDKVDAELWDSVSLDGKIYGIPLELPSGVVTYVRKDWLDRLDMKAPTNYEEFTEMLHRFKEEIPECKVPLTAPGFKTEITAMNLPEFYQGATPEFVKVDGQWIDGMAQDNIVLALTNLQTAYADGLIDTELITNTTSNCRDQWYSGSVGAFNYWSGLWGHTLELRLKQNVPNAEVLAINPIEGAIYESAVPTLLCINAHLSDDEIASIFDYFFEYMHDGGEGQVLFQSGVEGLHWEQDGNNIKRLPTLSNPEEVIQKAWITPWLPIAPLEVTDKNLSLEPMMESSLAITNEFSKLKNVYPVSETLTKVQSDILAIKGEVVSKIIMGEMTVEDGLAKYNTEAEMVNVKKVLEEMNTH